jgi:hypothetical protein
MNFYTIFILLVAMLFTITDARRMSGKRTKIMKNVNTKLATPIIKNHADAHKYIQKMPTEIIRAAKEALKGSSLPQLQSFPSRTVKRK